jgi:hypothetical protein
MWSGEMVIGSACLPHFDCLRGTKTSFGDFLVENTPVQAPTITNVLILKQYCHLISVLPKEQELIPEY